MVEESELTIWRKIDLTFSGEERVALTLALELCSEGLGRHLLTGDMALARRGWLRLLLLMRLELLMRDLLVAHWL